MTTLFKFLGKGVYGEIPYRVLLNMKKLKTFNTYNQITKLFDVTVMTKQQINKLDNNRSFLVLTPKKHIDVVDRSRKSRSRKPSTREMLLETRQILVDFIKEVRTQFKAHGWTK